jgi:hypothetical protein
MAKSTTYYLRKSHRWLGVIIGIQFLAWTVSGLYFSWNDIDEIHGDNLRNFPQPDIEIQGVISPSQIALLRDTSLTIKKVELIELFDNPYFRIEWSSDAKTKISLFDATSGELREPLTQKEAMVMAGRQFRPTADILEANYLTRVPDAHEYRGQPLPAWQVVYNDEAETRVYVSAELGEVIRFRTQRWRWFDWLWMWHIMDYDQRDDFNNALIKSFSILGLVTVLSGFVLFGATSRVRKKRKRGRS